jgi:hemoglobin
LKPQASLTRFHPANHLSKSQLPITSPQPSNIMKMERTNQKLNRIPHFLTGGISLVLLTASMTMLAGCGGSKAQTQNKEFFTSGSREADQRASQRMARDEQLAGTGEGAGEKGVKKASRAKAGAAAESPGGTNHAAQSTQKMSLFDRLGGVAGISNIVNDFTPRVLQDPRVNWQRIGVKHGIVSLRHDDSATWSATPDNVARLKAHMVQFLSLATGGPAHYEGKDMKSAHANMHITNAEFDAAIGDIKASLDKLQIPNKEQKELLAIIESSRPEISTER